MPANTAQLILNSRLGADSSTCPASFPLGATWVGAASLEGEASSTRPASFPLGATWVGATSLEGEAPWAGAASSNGASFSAG